MYSTPHGSPGADQDWPVAAATGRIVTGQDRDRLAGSARAVNGTAPRTEDREEGRVRQPADGLRCVVERRNRSAAWHRVAGQGDGERDRNEYRGRQPARRQETSRRNTRAARPPGPHRLAHPSPGASRPDGHQPPAEATSRGGRRRSLGGRRRGGLQCAAPPACGGTAIRRADAVRGPFRASGAGARLVSGRPGCLRHGHWPVRAPAWAWRR